VRFPSIYRYTIISLYSDSQAVLPSSMSTSCVRISRSPDRQHVQHAVLGLLRRAEYCENVTTHPATATAAWHPRPDTTARPHSVDIQTDKHTRTGTEQLKPNFITLAGSELVRTSKLVRSQIPLRYLDRTSSEPAPNRLRTRQRNEIWPRT